MKKVLIFFFCCLQIGVFAQKDTLTFIIGQKSDKYTDKKGPYFLNLKKSLQEIVNTTPLHFFSDNLGIKAEFVKCYIDTSIVKTDAQKEELIQMVKQKYSAAQADYLKINQQYFPEIIGTDMSNREFNSKKFLGKTTLIAVDNMYRDVYLSKMYRELDSLAKIFPDVNFALLSQSMPIEIEQTLKNENYAFPILANANEVCETYLGKNYPLSYYLILGKEGKVKNMIFIYDSDGWFSVSKDYCLYNLDLLNKISTELPFFSTLKKALEVKNLKNP